MESTEGKGGLVFREVGLKVNFIITISKIFTWGSCFLNLGLRMEVTQMVPWKGGWCLITDK